VSIGQYGIRSTPVMNGRLAADFFRPDPIDEPLSRLLDPQMPSHSEH
jgi:hypothetical protein